MQGSTSRVSLGGQSFQFTFYLRVTQESFLPPLWKLGQVRGARNPGKVRRQTLLRCPNSVTSSCPEPDRGERASQEHCLQGDLQREHSPPKRGCQVPAAPPASPPLGRVDWPVISVEKWPIQFSGSCRTHGHLIAYVSLHPTSSTGMLKKKKQNKQTNKTANPKSLLIVKNKM